MLLCGWPRRSRRSVSPEMTPPDPCGDGHQVIAASDSTDQAVIRACHRVWPGTIRDRPRSLPTLARSSRSCAATSVPESFGLASAQVYPMSIPGQLEVNAPLHATATARPLGPVPGASVPRLCSPASQPDSATPGQLRHLAPVARGVSGTRERASTTSWPTAVVRSHVLGAPLRAQLGEKPGAAALPARPLQLTAGVCAQ